MTKEKTQHMQINTTTWFGAFMFARFDDIALILELNLAALLNCHGAAEAGA